jgi:hypothetical protein
VNNPADLISQAERRRILTDGSAKTYIGQAQHMDQNFGGRYAKVHTTTVTGAGPGSGFPKMPANNPWATEPIGPEPFVDGTGEGNTLGYALTVRQRQRLLLMALVAGLTQRPHLRLDRSSLNGGSDVLGALAQSVLICLATLAAPLTDGVIDVRNRRVCG